MAARAPRRDTEHQQQSLFFAWTQTRLGQIPALESAYAVPNGSHKSKAQAGRFRAEGLKSGVPDICLPVAVVRELDPARTPLEHGHAVGAAVSAGDGGMGLVASFGVYGGLYIEMKSPENYPTPNQRAWADRLERQGMKVVRRCTTWQDAARHCLEYLGIEVTRRKFPELYVD